MSDSEAVVEARRKRRKRDTNLYDAVAGRVTSTLPLEDEKEEDDDDDPSDSEATATHPADHRHHHPRQPRQPSQSAGHHHRHPPHRSRRDPTLAPEEVLFRRAGAPVRFVEKDIYQAHEALPHGGRDVLPDSDMLKAVHSYASHFYAAAAQQQEQQQGGGAGGPRRKIGEKKGVNNNIKRESEEEKETEEKKTKNKRNKLIDEQSMDETALLAFGILLEEAGREALGCRGDLVFTEGVEVEVDESEQQPIDGDVGPVGFLDARRWRAQRSRRQRAPH